MGLHRDQLIASARQVLSPKLLALGYELEYEQCLDELNLMFRYISGPNVNDHLYRIIAIQPKGFGADDLFDLAVNLARYTTRNTLGPEKDHYPKQIGYIRLAPCLWEDRGGMDFWWHFLSEEDLEKAYEDILIKLVNYGIPFLNDPDSSFEVYYKNATGQELPKE
jgi:hypothetical protein